MYTSNYELHCQLNMYRQYTYICTDNTRTYVQTIHIQMYRQYTYICTDNTRTYVQTIHIHMYTSDYELHLPVKDTNAIIMPLVTI